MTIGANVDTQTVLSEVLAKIGEYGADGGIPKEISRLGVSIVNGGDVPIIFDQFEIRAFIGDQEITLASSGGDYTSPVAPLVRVSADLVTLATNGVGDFLIDVQGLSRLSVWAATAALVRASGVLTASANVTGSVAASGILTGTTIADADTVVADGETYLFKTALSTGPTVPNEILVGASDSDSLDNLIAAMNGAAGAGTTYSTGTVATPNTTAAAGGGDTLDLTADLRGTAGNAIVTTDTLTAGGWGAGTLASGVNGDTVTIGTQTYTFNASTLVDTPDEVLVGAAATNSLDNLIAAVNGAAGEGTTYGTGTVENVDSDAAAGAGDTIDLDAVALGSAGNIVTTEVSSVLSFAAGTLVGGTGPSTSRVRIVD